jgi:hypothetical protein
MTKATMPCKAQPMPNPIPAAVRGPVSSILAALLLVIGLSATGLAAPRTFTEDFATTAFRDSANTTAWRTRK